MMVTLEQLRAKIDKLDASIIKQLAARQRLVIRIGKLKATSGKAVLNQEREAQLMQRYDRLCEEYDIEPQFIKRLFANIFAHSRKLQRKLIKKKI